MDILLQTTIICISLLVFLFISNLFIKKYLYKYDAKKQKSTLTSLNILTYFTIVFIIIEEYSHGNIALISKIFIIFLSLKIIYHLLGYYFIKSFGKKLLIEEEIKSKKQIDILLEKYENKILEHLNIKKNITLIEKIKNDKIKLDLDKIYSIKNGSFYKNIEKYVSNKTTSLIDIGLIIILSLFALALILPIIKPLNEILSNDYMLAIFAFLGAYVLNPAFPDMYAFFTFVRNKNIDLEKFISFWDNGKLIKGRIIEMSTSHIILKDHVSGISLTIPNMNLHNKIINNLNDLNEHLGYKRTLSYVIDFPTYQKDMGIKLKSIFMNLLYKFENETNLISKQEKYNVWIVSNNDGVELKLWYFIKDIQNEEKIKLDLEDFILYETAKQNIDLRTPKLLEIIKN